MENGRLMSEGREGRGTEVECLPEGGPVSRSEGEGDAGGGGGGGGGRWRIGVEPVLFLYMFAFMITTVVEEAFFVHKACLVNLGLPANVCDHISEKENAKYKQEVQIEVSTFHQYENIASHAVPVGLAFFLGAWSDKVGRKLPLLLGLIGNLVYSFMIVINALQVSWPLEIVIYSASFPCGLTGGSLTVFMSAFSYLADTTSEEDRTLRTTLLEVAYLIPMPVGIALGSYLFEVLDHSYALMFTINCAFLVASILYTAVFLEWRTVSTCEPPPPGWCGSVWSLVDLRHAVESVKSIFKKRPQRRRTYLLLVLLGMSLYTFQRDEKHMSYLYTQLEFNWTVKDFSHFKTFQSSLFVAGLLIAAPILNRIVKLKDTLTIMLGAFSHTAARMFFIFAKEPWLFYVGAGVGTLGPIVAPVFRSVTSKLVPATERGKVFAIFTVSDTTVPLVSGIIYTQVYNHTIATFPQAVFLVTAASQVCVFAIALFLHCMFQGRDIQQAEEVQIVNNID